LLTLSNANVKRRYLAAKEKARDNGERFTYADMAKMFDTDDRTIYTWITEVEKLQHLPTNESKRAKLSAWINDGTLGRKK
jgi:hypothetical protein